MSRASTVKPPALAMPSRRAAVSAGFPVRRRRPDAGDCRHQGEYAGACPFWTGSLFLCLFSFFLLPKDRYLPKHGLRGDLFRIRAGRQGRPRGPEGARRQDRLCGERCRVVRKAVARLVPLSVEREAACGAGSGGTGRLLRMDGETPSGSRLAERLLPHGAIVPPCAVVLPSSARWRSDWEDISIFHALMGAARGRRRGVCPG